MSQVIISVYLYVVVISYVFEISMFLYKFRRDYSCRHLYTTVSELTILDCIILVLAPLIPGLNLLRVIAITLEASSILDKYTLIKKVRRDG